MTDFSTSFSNGTTSSAAAPTTLDIAAVVAMLDKIPPDPLASWMRQQGFDPNRGGILVLPPEMATHLGPFLPRYVKLSKLTDVPVLVWSPDVLRTPLDTFVKEPR